MTRPLVGLDMFYYAPLTQDDAGGVVYDTPVRVNNAVSLTVNPNSQIQPFYADDGPREVFSQVGEIDVSIMVADLPPEDYAYLIGADYNAGTGVVDYSVDAAAPDVAIGFRAQKTNGSYRYVWLLKGKFGVPNMEHQTKEGSVNFQSQTINGKFMARTNDDQVFRRVDGDDTNAMAGLPGSWFVDPNLGAVVTADAPVVTGFAAPGNDVATWTFDKSVSLSRVSHGYFTLYDVTNDEYIDSADITLTVGTDAEANDQVILTLDPVLAPGVYVAQVGAGFMAEDGGMTTVNIYRTWTVS